MWKRWHNLSENYEKQLKMETVKCATEKKEVRIEWIK